MRRAVSSAKRAARAWRSPSSARARSRAASAWRASSAAAARARRLVGAAVCVVVMGLASFLRVGVGGEHIAEEQIGEADADGEADDEQGEDGVGIGCGGGGRDGQGLRAGVDLA